MAEQARHSTQSDHGVYRLVVEYVDCPQCELLAPAFTGPEPLSVVADGTMSRCGICKWVFSPGPRLPLELRHTCNDCGSTMRAPIGAAVLVCPACEAWFHNPALDESGQRRAEAALREQDRIASMLGQPPGPVRARGTFRRNWYDHRLPTPRAASPAGLTGSELGTVRALHRPRTGSGVRQTAPVPVVFSSALRQAVQDALPPRQQRAMELRYGLRGGTGQTFAQIGAELHRSPSRAREILHQGIRTIVMLGREADASPSPTRLNCSIVMHLAAHMIGDPTDPRTPQRLVEFLTSTLPGASATVGTELLVRLSGRRDQLTGLRQDRALYRAVTAHAHP
jgi:sigma-70-like protein